jgi:hypothetical protein
MQMRRVLSGLLGALLLFGTVVEAIRGSLGFYREYYLMPREKYGVITALRWQDIAFFAAFWAVVIALLYVSYRLLRLAFRHEPSANA